MDFLHRSSRCLFSLFISISYMATESSKRFRSEDSPVDSSPSSCPSVELLSCPFCTFNTSSPADFEFHQHIQHQHLCSQCLHIFPSYFLLDLHMDEVHNNYSTTRSYRCLIELCSKTFSSLDQRLQHLNLEHHTKDPDFNEIYTFFSNSPLPTKIANEQAKKFGCDSQKTFLRNSRLRTRQFFDQHWDGDE